MRRTLLICAIAIVALLALPLAAHAATTVYNNDFTGWAAAAGPYSTEAFDDAVLPWGSVTFANYGFTGDISGGVLHDRIGPGGDPTKFLFDNPITAWGGNFDCAPGGPGTAIAVLMSNGWTYVGEVSENNTGQFWGFVSDEPFFGVKLYSGSNPSGTGIAETYDLDNMVFAAPYKCNEVKISDDLIAQTDCATLKASLKVHPTLQVCLDQTPLSYECLNPATNPVAKLTMNVFVKSNLPWFKQISVSTPTYSDKNVDLQSYELVEGVLSEKPVPWPVDPVTGKPLMQLPGISAAGERDTFCAGGSFSSRERGATQDCEDPALLTWTGWTEWAAAGANGIIGPIGYGDIDHHIWQEQIEWTTPPINWCVTAGYYDANIKVCVYQN